MSSPVWLNNPALRRQVLIDRFEHPVCFVKHDALRAFAQTYQCLYADAKVATCADAFDVYLAVNDNKIVATQFSGDGCVISTTAADVYLEMLKGCDFLVAEQRTNAFIALVQNGTKNEHLPETCLLFDRVYTQPGRIACAMTVAAAVAKILP